MKYASWDQEIAYTKQGITRLAGLDEVGRGCWAGPLVAAAYMFHTIPTNISVGDSKTISEKQRILLVDHLKGLGDWGIGEVSSEEIDTLGLQSAQFLAYERAIANLAADPELVLLDGRDVSWRPCARHPQPAAQHSDVGIPDSGASHRARMTESNPQSYTPLLECIIDGDAKISSIAAASLIAKVHRDTLMKTTYHTRYPSYSFDLHVGYGTKLHQEALAIHGVTSIHRKSFKPIKKYIDSVA